jgi:uncharacterized cupredoxin-like copper-binding protein
MRRSVVLAAVIGLVAVSTSGAAAAAKAQKLTITLTEFRFTPRTVTLQVGVPVELTLANKGTVDHEFMVYAPPKSAPDDWDEYVMENTYFKDMGEVAVVFRNQGAVASTRMFEVELEKGKTATVLFTPTRKGTFEIGCHVEGHYEGGMKGTLVVK